VAGEEVGKAGSKSHFKARQTPEQCVSQLLVRIGNVFELLPRGGGSEVFEILRGAEKTVIEQEPLRTVFLLVVNDEAILSKELNLVVNSRRCAHPPIQSHETLPAYCVHRHRWTRFLSSVEPFVPGRTGETPAVGVCPVAQR